MKTVLFLFLLGYSSLLFAAEMRDVGSLSFKNSGAKEAQPYFLRGVGLLHSFGWKQAISEFKKAQEADPDFALAYWGESLCYNHPLITERNRQSPIKVLERLGSTFDERLAKSQTKREKGFISAVEALFNGQGNTAQRRIAYKDSMQQLYEQFPGDDEIAAFYTLSLLSAAGASGDARMQMNVLAGSIATRLYRKNSNHPGAAHYVIHSFDDPLHAPLALDAAQKFAKIAPVVSHARHMPSHIFIQHGMWEEVSRSNQSAFDAAKALWEPGDRVGDMVHSLDWGQYGDLQLGDYDKARLWITRLEEIDEASGGQASNLARARARLIIETEDWQLMEVSEETHVTSLLAAGMSAIALGDLESAMKIEKLLDKKAKDEAKKEKKAYTQGPIPTEIMYKEIAALVKLARGHEAEALELLAEGVALTRKLPPPRGTAIPQKPVHELYAEVLSQVGQYEESVAMFQASLTRTPNRPRSLLGLARTYAKLGDRNAAAKLYRKLAEIRKGHDVLDRQEAEQYLSTVRR
ncbi:MAG: tetratricopeptide repeat protein [Gammaproteobacteria bacterium]|nr:tetratricopeptide repeat protein [Gammaproteobacteria bacterium]